MLQKLLVASPPQGGSKPWGLFSCTVLHLLAVTDSLTPATFSFVCLPREHNCISLPFLSSPFTTTHHLEPEPQIVSRIRFGIVNVHQEKRQAPSMKRSDPTHSWKRVPFPLPDPKTYPSIFTSSPDFKKLWLINLSG